MLLSPIFTGAVFNNLIMANLIGANLLLSPIFTGAVFNAIRLVDIASKYGTVAIPYFHGCCFQLIVSVGVSCL